MSVNPFGESDSVFAWKERFKQQQFQTQTMQQRVSELKLELDQIKQLYDALSINYETTKEELTKTKKELNALVIIAKEKEEKVNLLENSIDMAGVTKLKQENENLKRELENLQGQITRGDVKETSISLTDVLTPLMLREFDPENPRFSNAFVDLVEIIIKEGDIFQKIIGVLIKHGGRGSIENVEQIISNQEFSFALKTLIDEKIVKVIDDQLSIESSVSFVSKKEKWDEMELDEIFNLLKQIIESETDDLVIKSLDMFRDTLQEREIPLAKIFFEIRKMSEGIRKNIISRKDAFNQVENWWERIQNT